MWDKNLDEGIFLCDHNSHILTKEFLISLKYVATQFQMIDWIEPNEFLLNSTDLVAYILLKNSKELRLALWYNGNDIKLTNRRLNEIFQGIVSDEFSSIGDRKLFIYKLFESG